MVMVLVVVVVVVMEIMKIMDRVSIIYLGEGSRVVIIIMAGERISRLCRLVCIEIWRKRMQQFSIIKKTIS
jgi:hypothetical protein